MASDKDGDSAYARGVRDAAAHRRATEDNWLRPTLGPVMWLGVPLLISWLYVRRSSGGSSGKLFGLGGGGGGGSSSGNNPFADLMEQMMPIKKRQFRVDVKGTTFKDVIGVPEAVNEVRQYVDFLTDPGKFTRLGARLPKGCLLTGEPGTGKTLLAKAVAGEASVPFFSCSGADFIELMGGSGPKRVRELFAEARAAAPAIIFIDEIDAVGSRASARGGGGGSVSSEENRTINQLLAELDGLSTSSDAIVVMAATNFQDNIDKALLREGRFDRKVVVDMPDVAARRELFAHYLGKVCTGDPNGRTTDEAGAPLPVDAAISNTALASVLAERTPGLSPATIATIVNEAALQSGIAGKPLVPLSSLYEAVDNTLMGRPHRNRQGKYAARRVAVYEAGCALVSWMLPPVATVLKVSVVPRGNALSHTQRAGTEFHEYQTNATLFADVVVLLSGRAAEEVVFGDLSANAADSLQRATDMALKLMLAFGMSSRVGLLAYHPEYTQVGRDFTTYSDASQHRAELAAQRVVAAAHDMAVQLIREHVDKLHALVDELAKHKEVDTATLERLWGPRPTRPTVDELVQRVLRVTDGPLDNDNDNNRDGVAVDDTTDVDAVEDGKATRRRDTDDADAALV